MIYNKRSILYLKYYTITVFIFQIMDASGTMTEGEKTVIEEFRRPRVLPMADASAFEIIKRISLGPVEITQVRFILMKLI